MILKMQTKEEIQNTLSSVFNELNEQVSTINAKDFKVSKNGKWNIAQNIEHLTLSNNITALSFRMPKTVLQRLFKIHRSANLNYDEVTWRYQKALGNGAKAALAFQPIFSKFPVIILVLKFWKLSCSNLLSALKNWSEADLDTYQVQHPILGKISLRELALFTIYHTRHHLNTIKQMK
jgi:hypothetical protein